MFNSIYRKRLSLTEEIKILFWRQTIRLERGIIQVQAKLIPIRYYLWLPVVALLVGMVLGILISVA